jgi:hypothetical protein
MGNTEIIVPTALPVTKELGSMSEAAEVGRQIGASWQKAAAQVLDTAELCLMAFERYHSRGLPAVLRAADMSKSTFMKLITIGRDQRLRRIETLLPPSFTIIWTVTQLSDQMFDEAIRAEVIHPHVRRAEIEALRKSSGSKVKHDNDLQLPAAVSEITAGSRYELIVPKGIPADQCAEIKKTFGALRRKFGVDIIFIRELDASKTAASPVISSEPGGSPVNRPLGGTRTVSAAKQPEQ